MLTRILLDPQGGEGNGNNANGNPSGSNAPSKADLSAQAQVMVQKNGGDPIKVISRLLKENHGNREEIRGLRGKLPADGSIVLSGDDAKRYKSYLELGEDPKVIRQRLESGDAAIVERDSLAAEKTYARAAPLGGYKEGPFKALAIRDKLKIAIETAKGKDGKDAEVAFVLGEGNKKTPLAEYVNANWADFKDSLGGHDQKKPAGIPGRANDNTPAPRPGTGTPDAMAVYLKAQGQPGI